MYALIATGMRIGELIALTIEDVCFEENNNRIFINKQYTRDMALPYTKQKR